MIQLKPCLQPKENYKKVDGSLSSFIQWEKGGVWIPNFFSFHIRFLGQDSKQEIYLHINDKMVIMLNLEK